MSHKSSLVINRPPTSPRVFSVSSSPSAPPLPPLPRSASVRCPPSPSLSFDTLTKTSSSSVPSSACASPVALPKRAQSKKGSLSSLSHFTVAPSCLSGATVVNHLERRATMLALAHVVVGIACLVANVVRYTQDAVHVLAVEGMALGGAAIVVGALGVVCTRRPHRWLIAVLLAACVGLLAGAILVLTTLIWLVIIHVTTWRVRAIVYDVCVVVLISVSTSLAVLCCKALFTCCGSPTAKQNVTAGGQTFTITINTK